MDMDISHYGVSFTGSPSTSHPNLEDRIKSTIVKQPWTAQCTLREESIPLRSGVRVLDRQCSPE
jgi:hypothetical protein